MPSQNASPPLSCRDRFPALAPGAVPGIRVFADNSSRAQMPEGTLQAVARQMLQHETHRGGHPEWDSPRAAAMATLRVQSREAAAAFCGGLPAQIGFAANGTGTLAVLARALFGTVLQPGDTVVVTEADHEANRVPWQTLERFGCRVVDVPIAADGALDEAAWKAALARGPKVAALCMVSNVTGVVLPFESMARQAHDVGCAVVLDAVQGPPHGLIDVMACPHVDAAVFSNCKLFSPHLGWWALRAGLLERMGLVPAEGAHPALEWGTVAHADHAGFVATHAHFRGLTPAGTLKSGMDAVRRHESLLTRRFLDRLPASLHGALLAADTPHPRIPIFSLPLARPHWVPVREAFERAGLDVRIGQFGCPATLRRLTPRTQATALRMSFVHYNTPADVDAVCEVLHDLRAMVS
jgi:cysteine desulfurase/selenocysteine lyase